MNIYINTVIFKQLITGFFLLFIVSVGYTQVIPDQIEYCGMKLSFTPGAKQSLEEYVNKIYENPRYYNQMVMKARTYMPIIEEAFRNHDLPEDLKYIAIQESGLQANATSISQTVGFWQLSTELAAQIGLQVDEQIDERMHAFRSSSAVAYYFGELFKSSDNWVYTTIAYHEGITETAPFTDPRYYGQSFMMIDRDLHWYAMKVLAYKIAYENALKMPDMPNIWLEPVLAKGGTTLKKIYKDQAIDVEEFYAYNLWLKVTERLPKDIYYTVYIPRKQDTYQGYINDPVYELEKLTGVELGSPSKLLKVNRPSSRKNYKQTIEANDANIESPSSSFSRPEKVIEKKEVSNQEVRSIPLATQVAAKNITELDANQYALFDIKYDIDYNLVYIEYDANYSLLETASTLSIGFNNLLTNNQLGPNEKPKDGRILYLQNPLKTPYHIVDIGESLVQIAFRHNKTVAFLQERNRMQTDDFNIYIGQKLYLRKKKPKGEKIIVLKGKILNNEQIVEGKIKQKRQGESISNPELPEKVSTSQKNEISYPIKNNISDNNQSFSQWIEHEVLEGETLLGIATKYNTKVEIIKQINKLDADHVVPGSVLRILADE